MQFNKTALNCIVDERALDVDAFRKLDKNVFCFCYVSDVQRVIFV